MQLNRKIAAGLAAGALAAGLMGSVPAMAAAQGDDKTAVAPAEQAQKYVWGKVTARTGLLIRSYPSTSSRVLGSYEKDARVKLSCKAESEAVNGDVWWYKLADRSGWLTAAYVDVYASLPTCVPSLLDAPK